MGFRNWLLTGTSLTLLALAPMSAVRAQDASDPALVAAYSAFQADQSEANQLALTEACIAAGFASLDECIAALAGVAPVESMPAEEPAAEEAPPAEPPAAEEPAPEAPAPEAPAAEEPAPEAPAPEAPAAEEPPPVEQPAPEAPAAEEPAPEQPAAEEPAVEEPAVEEPAVEQPAVSEEAPAVDPLADILAQLTAAVDLYNEGVAELDAGNTEGQVKVDTAQAQIDAICSAAGYADSASCLAEFGLTLNPLPPMAEPPATEDPAADEPVTEDTTEVLEGVPEEDAAPILDSEKDVEPAVTDEGAVTEEPAPDAPVADEPVAEEPAPAPESDQAAQQDIAPPAPIAEEEGEVVDAFDFGFADPDDEVADEEEGGGGFVVPDEEAGQKVEIVQAPTRDNPNFVFRIGIHIYISNVERERDRYYDRDQDEIYYERLSNGRIRETIERPNGVKIVTVYNRYGDVLRRTKIYPDNREFYLATYDPRDDEDGFFIDPGDELPPLRLTISARDYILDAEEADEDEVEVFLSQPPVEKVRRIYSIDEVKRSARLRDTVRRLEIGNLTFDTGKATISRDQVSSLSKVASAMLKLLERNPAEVFLIEGHTDAVGSDLSNLQLSDERASTIARILTEFYEVPPENLTTQGYGERYLKVKTTEAEELNRRVTVKRITPLVNIQASN